MNNVGKITMDNNLHKEFHYTYVNCLILFLEEINPCSSYCEFLLYVHHIHIWYRNEIKKIYCSVAIECVCRLILRRTT